MKVELGRKIELHGCCGSMAPESEKKDEIRFPRLDIQLTDKSIDLLEALGTAGSAKISYKMKRMSAGEEWDDSKGSVCLEITSIEPIESEEPDDEDLEDDTAEEALAKFMKNSKKVK